MIYRAQAFPKNHEHAGYYGIRNATGSWVNKYGQPDADYHAENAGVAKMRARDLRIYAADAERRSR